MLRSAHGNVVFDERKIMSDNLKKKGAADRSRVSGSELWEVRDMAKSTNSTQAEVRQAIKKVGPSRERVKAELNKKK